MPPEPDNDAPAESVHETDSDVQPCLASAADRDDAEISLGDQPVRGPDDTDDFTPEGR